MEMEERRMALGPLFGRACVLFASSIILTYQKPQFSRAYAVYGGFFIVLSFLGGWALDKVQPDLSDCIGSLVIIVGAMLIMFVPRKVQSSRTTSLPYEHMHSFGD